MNSPQDSSPHNPAKSPSRKLPILAALAVIGLPILGWLAFGYFGIQAAFLDSEVNESADDLFTTPAVEVSDDDQAPVAETEEEPEPESEAEPEAEQEAAAETEVSVPEADATDDQAPAAEAEADPEAQPEPEEAAEAAPGEIVTIASGEFGSVNGYSVAGDALVLNNGTEQRFLRFENFVSDNGPDLKVYLRAASGEFVSLGNLSGNIGDQNYEIPTTVDLSEFNTVEIWCERFSVGFGAASLS